MGRGFCFEARQKRITFDNKHYRIDLVFYHRILKTHILLDLKIGEFDHSDAGQMNMYLNYYKDNEFTNGDNDPIGIILCSGKVVNFVSAIHNNWKMSLPTGVCFVKKDVSYINKEGKTKKKSSVSKQEHFRTLVKHGAQHLRFRYVLADIWFACSDNMRFVLEDCGRDFIMAMKENRKVALSKQDKANGKYTNIKESVSEKCVWSVYVEQLNFRMQLTGKAILNSNRCSTVLWYFLDFNNC
jgi:hypothetical protein